MASQEFGGATARPPHSVLPGPVHDDAVKVRNVSPGQQRPQKFRQEDEPVKDEVPIVQFSAGTYFCNEDEPHMVMEVLRIGNISGKSKVRFSTVDSTGKAGKLYEHTEGTLVFKPGMPTAELSVPIIQNKYWDTTQDFGVELQLEDLENAVLGPYLWFTRVKVINGCCFPTNRFSIEISGNCLKFVPKSKLFLEYVRMNMRHMNVYKTTVLICFLELIQGIIVCVMLVASLAAFGVVFNPALEESEVTFGSRRGFLSLLVCSGIILLPFLHICERIKARSNLGGTLRAMLQKNMLRKFLNFTEASRSDCADGELRTSMQRDIGLLVDKGFMNLFTIVREIGIFSFMLLFQLFAPVAVGEPTRYWGWVPLMLYPFPMVLIIMMITHMNRPRLYEKKMCSEDLMKHISDAEGNYRLIADYNQHTFFLERHERRIAKYHDSAMQIEILRLNANRSVWYLTLLILISHTIAAGGDMAVQINTMSSTRLGFFVLDLAILAKNNAIWSSVLMTILDIQSTFYSLERLTKLLNLPIDVPARMKLNRRRREITLMLRQKAFAEMEQQGDSGKRHVAPVDRLPILAENLHFSHLDRSGGGTEVQNATLNYGGTVEIAQGQLVAFVGPQGEGKSTLLRVIGDMLIQDDVRNVVFVPSHLRVLHVNSEPMFFHGTLFANLTFGTAQHGDRFPRRVEAICKGLGLGSEVLCHLSTKRSQNWGVVLSQTQKHLLTLARALISNPEILCLHKPTLAFDEATSIRVLRVLKEFVRQKGLYHPPTVKARCRPRTCLMTSAKMLGVQYADKVFHVSTAKGVSLIEKDPVTGELLVAAPETVMEAKEDVLEQLMHSPDHASENIGEIAGFGAENCDTNGFNAFG
eukprot:TRINITY_DN2906_c0_g3_i1.p1 TRINITY_DN2906_c0_g3~~TRINITY_DN2906_c0_g3_i1.p1  ORF type:complete len:866 (+),score=111.61 TRINITY_DN2906_c0_g3_i1:138-2735(+)